MFKNIITLCLSVVVSLFVAEGVLRALLDPVDYLAVETEADPFLNHRIGAGASGHDEWGYRNLYVPERADILVIGDSMAYGTMAKSYESWPAQLQQDTGISVYNASLGGYGPVHYLRILRSRAPELSPKAVLIMVYLGNDIMDTYNLVYSNDNWANYRVQEQTVELDANLFVPTSRHTSFARQVRNWLARHSILYRITTQNALFDVVRQRELLEGNQTAIVHEHLGSTVILDPGTRLSFSDVTDPRIKDGMRIVDRVLSEIAAYCAKEGIALHVAIMPVREQVFYNIATGELKNNESLQELDENLDALQAQLEQALNKASVAYTNLLPVMENAQHTQNIYPPADGHPNAAGYKVVASYLAPILRSLVAAN